MADESQCSWIYPEEPHMYPSSVAGGYIPLKIGQKLTTGPWDTEFTVLRKLGWGASGSVWLVHSE